MKDSHSYFLPSLFRFVFYIRTVLSFSVFGESIPSSDPMTDNLKQFNENSVVVVKVIIPLKPRLVVSYEFKWIGKKRES